MINTSILEEIGLTKSEIKVYLALLKLGESKKCPIVRESKISSSKIYDVTGKLIDKGLVSVIIKNKIKHFKAAPPETLIDMINERKISLTKKESQLKKIVPGLNKIMQERIKKEIAEMYIGWKGLETLYSIILGNLKRGQIDYVLGASMGIHNERTERFYTRVNKKLKEKGIKLDILFGNKAKEYAKRVSKRGGLKYHKSRFLDFNFPVEVNIFNDNVAIIILGEEPMGFLVRNKLLADNFIAYFNSLWKVSNQ